MADPFDFSDLMPAKTQSDPFDFSDLMPVKSASGFSPQARPPAGASASAGELPMIGVRRATAEEMQPGKPGVPTAQAPTLGEQFHDVVTKLPSPSLSSMGGAAKDAFAAGKQQFQTPGADPRVFSGSQALGFLGMATSPLAALQQGASDMAGQAGATPQISERVGDIAGLIPPGAAEIPRAPRAAAPKPLPIEGRIEPTVAPRVEPNGMKKDLAHDDFDFSDIAPVQPKQAGSLAKDPFDFSDILPTTAPDPLLPPKKNKPTLVSETNPKLLNFQKELIAKNAEPSALPADHASRMARAKQLGFDTDKTFYHGTSKGFLEFAPEKGSGGEKGVFLTDDPDIANSYGFGEGKQIVPLLARMQKPLTIDAGGSYYSNPKMVKWLQQAKDGGHDVLVVKNIHDAGSLKPQTQYAFLKPENLRAKYGAQFDPAKKRSANMLSASNASLSDIVKGNAADYAKLEVAAKEPGFVEGLKRAAKNIQSIFSPETVDDAAHRAVLNIRKNVGQGVRASEQTSAAVEQFQGLVNSMDLDTRLDLMEFMQSASQRNGAADEFAPMVKALQDAYQSRRREMEALPKLAKMGFQEDYLPQMWKDPAAAKRFFANEHGSKEGSSGFTKGKKYDSYADGIRAGLVPQTTDPIEMVRRYVENADRYIATHKVLDEAIKNTDVVFRKEGNAPEGYTKLDGAIARRAPPGQEAFAPDGWATIYNNFVSRRFDGAVGNLLDDVQEVSNTVTAFKLGLSGYHAVTTVKEAMSSGIADAIDQAMRGQVLGAGKALAASPIKPVSSYRLGKQMQKAYLGDLSSASPKMQRIINLATDANFRVVGKGRIADEYRYSNAGSFVEAFRKGALKGEFAADLQGIKSRPLVGSTKAAFKNVARVMETISDPLFKTYIPAVKNGAFYDMLSSWLEAHPNATHAEQADYAQYAADQIDNRFGEMQRDNIFWSAKAKQLASLGMTSFSYELGTARNLGGAAIDTAKALTGRGGWTPKMSYTLGLIATMATTSAVYEYLHTGKAPESVRDLVAPPTGGTDIAAGAPERAILPGSDKDIRNLAHDPAGELTNKLNPFFSTMLELAKGKDWRGDEIAKHRDDFASTVGAYLKFAAQMYTPIPFQNKARKGTEISGPERLMGVNPAPAWLSNPKRTEGYAKKAALAEDRKKMRHDAIDKMREK